MLKQSEKQPLLSVQNCTLFITSVVIDEESINFFSAWHMYPIGKQLLVIYIRNKVIKYYFTDAKNCLPCLKCR